MRITPFGIISTTPLSCGLMAALSCYPTHTHPIAILIGVLHALAIHRLLLYDASVPLNTRDFLMSLLQDLDQFTSVTNNQPLREVYARYSSLSSGTIPSISFPDWDGPRADIQRVFDSIIQFSSEWSGPATEEVITRIIDTYGNDVTAHRSWPTVMVCFLRGVELGYDPRHCLKEVLQVYMA